MPAKGGYLIGRVTDQGFVLSPSFSPSAADGSIHSIRSFPFLLIMVNLTSIRWGSFHSAIPEVASLPQGVLFVCTSAEGSELCSLQGWTAVRRGPKQRRERVRMLVGWGGGGGTREKLRGWLPLQSVCLRVPGVPTPAIRFSPSMQAGMENGYIYHGVFHSSAIGGDLAVHTYLTGLAVSILDLGYISSEI